MLNAKQVADFVTIFRGILGFGLVWIGLTEGVGGLNKVILIMIIAWTGDAIDGKIARRSKERYQTWVGSHDLEIDLAIACALLVYMLTSGFVNPWVASIYVLVWTIILWNWKNLRVLAMVSQAPIYAYFIVIALTEQPNVGVWIIVWVVLAIIITWPQFPNLVVPGFLKGMREFLINFRSVSGDK